MEMKLTTDVINQIERTLSIMEDNDFADIDVSIDSIAWQIINQEYGYTIVKGMIDNQILSGKKIKNIVTFKIKKLETFFELLKKAIIKHSKEIKEEKTFITKDFKIRMSPGAVNIIDEDKVPIEYFAGEGFDMIDMIISNIENDEKYPKYSSKIGKYNDIKIKFDPNIYDQFIYKLNPVVTTHENQLDTVDYNIQPHMNAFKISKK